MAKRNRTACTSENIERLKELYYKDGMTYQKIAHEIGVSPASVVRMVNELLEENKLKRRGTEHKRTFPLWKDEKALETAKKMYSEGVPSVKIGEMLGVNHTTVLRTMKRLGITRGNACCTTSATHEDTAANRHVVVDGEGESLEEAMARVESADNASTNSEGKDTVASLYKKGYGADAIATKLGISVNGVYAALDAMPKEEQKFTEKTGVAERMKDALKALMDTDETTDGTSKDIMESRKNYWADVVAKAQETYETARDRINDIADDMNPNGTAPTDITANETAIVGTDSKDMEDIVVDIMSDAFNGLVRAHGKILMAWADGAYIPETGADMFSSLDRLSAAEKEVWNVAVNLKNAVQNGDK